MGSDSDLPVMAECARVLEGYGIAYDIQVLSAHRTPDAAVRYARGAAGRGLKVFVAGAGGAAHLAGVLAAHTLLPVIGVPLKSKALQGHDSLLSIVQMPAGVPVAAVAIDGGRNAGLLAVQILATSDADLFARLLAYKEQLAESTREKDRRLQERLRSRKQ